MSAPVAVSEAVVRVEQRGSERASAVAADEEVNIAYVVGLEHDDNRRWCGIQSSPRFVGIGLGCERIEQRDLTASDGVRRRHRSAEVALRLPSGAAKLQVISHTPAPFAGLTRSPAGHELPGPLTCRSAAGVNSSSVTCQKRRDPSPESRRRSPANRSVCWNFKPDSIGGLTLKVSQKLVAVVARPDPPAAARSGTALQAAPPRATAADLTPQLAVTDVPTHQRPIT